MKYVTISLFRDCIVVVAAGTEGRWRAGGCGGLRTETRELGLAEGGEVRHLAGERQVLRLVDPTRPRAGTRVTHVIR